METPCHINASHKNRKRKFMGPVFFILGVTRFAKDPFYATYTAYFFCARGQILWN